jgi:hypothetical protein
VDRKAEDGGWKREDGSGKMGDGRWETGDGRQERDAPSAVVNPGGSWRKKKRRREGEKMAPRLRGRELKMKNTE